jgi:hypothetical protein
MTTSADLRRLALSLEGTTEAPHFERTAFKARRIYVTLAPDGETANFMFAPEQQEFKCMMAPDAFAPVPNAWGQRGATTAILSRLTFAELEDALRAEWATAEPAKPSRSDWSPLGVRFRRASHAARPNTDDSGIKSPQNGYCAAGASVVSRAGRKRSSTCPGPLSSRA